MISSVDGVITLPEGNYDDVIQILFTLDADSCDGSVELSDLFIAGCIGHGK